MFSINAAEVNELQKIISQVVENPDFYSTMLRRSNIDRLEKLNDAFESFLAAEESWADCAHDEPDTNIILGME